MRNCMIAVIGIVTIALIGSPSPAKPDKDGSDRLGQDSILPAIQGVWQQISLQQDKIKLEETDPKTFEFLKVVYVVAGKNLYTAKSNLHGVGVWHSEIKVRSTAWPAAIDCIDLEDNRTIRSLVDFNKDLLVVCSNARGKTLRLPDKIAATADFQVKRFKKLQPAAKKIFTGEKPRVTPEGVWRTIEVEFDGNKYSGESKTNEQKDHFWTRQRFYYFQADIYTMCSAENSDLCVTHKPYRLVPKLGKHAIDFTTDDNKTIAAIFEQIGDCLVLCWNERTFERPEQFTTGLDDGSILLRFERVDKNEPNK